MTGAAADFVDLQSSLKSHLPLALAIVVVATFVILFLMTGSVVLPIKSLLMNVLNLSAVFGLLVLIFQDGRLEGLLGYSSDGGIEQTMPILLFAVAFGLSTDYAVFLLSRIKEARDGGASDSECVAIGLERTGRIVTAAALLFAIAIGAFATSEIIFIKENGIGTALAVLIDATIIRALLVPSLMELLGKWNWWAPAPLRRLHRRIGISEARDDPDPEGARRRHDRRSPLMAPINPGRYTANTEGDFVVFLIGMRINRPLRIRKWWPVFVAMPKMIRELEAHPEKGMLHAEFALIRSSLAYVSTGAASSTWRASRAIRTTPICRPGRSSTAPSGPRATSASGTRPTGSRAGECEAIYGNMPAWGLAEAFERVPVGSTVGQSAARRIGSAEADDVAVAPYANPGRRWLRIARRAGQSLRRGHRGRAARGEPLQRGDP